MVFAEKRDGSSETQAHIYQTTRRHIPEDRNINTHRHQGFEPTVFWYLHQEIHSRVSVAEITA
jgi:hypothetical protein